MAERKVLIIDDDDTLLPMLKTAFKRYQFEVQVTNDGADGLELARKHSHDLVLLSVELPVGNGFLVCKEFKQDPKLKDIPVIITSRKATDADFEKHRKLKVRANDYLHKPFTDEELFAKVGNVVGFALSPDEFSELEAKVHDFLEERTQLEAEINDKAERIAELEAELDAASKGGKDSSKAEKRLADAEERIAELNASVASWEEKAATAEAALLERDARLAELEHEMGQKAGELQALQKDGGAKDKKIAALESSLAESEKRTAAFEQAIAGHEEKVATLELSNGNLTERLTKAEEKAAGLQSKLEQLQGREQELKTQAKESQARAEDLAEQLERLKASNQALQTQLETQQALEQKLNGRFEALQAQLREASDEKDTLVEKLTGTEKLVASVAAALGVSAEELASAAKRVQADAKRALQLDEELTVVKGNLAALEGELGETRKSLEKETKKRNKLREVLEKAITTLE